MAENLKLAPVNVEEKLILPVVSCIRQCSFYSSYVPVRSFPIANSQTSSTFQSSIHISPSARRDTSPFAFLCFSLCPSHHLLPFLPPHISVCLFPRSDPIQSTANIGFDFSAAAGLSAVRQAPCYDMQKIRKERREKKKKKERVRHELYADRNREL